MFRWDVLRFDVEIIDFMHVVLCCVAITQLHWIMEHVVCVLHNAI